MPSKISILIPEYDEGKIERSISAVNKNAGIDPSEYTILTEKCDKNEGRVKLINRMVSRVGTEYVVLLGDDVIAKKNFLKNAMNKMLTFEDGVGLIALNDEVTDGKIYALHWLASMRLLPLLGGSFLYQEYHDKFCNHELSIRCKFLKKYKFAVDAMIEHVLFPETDYAFEKGTVEQALRLDIIDRNLFETRINALRQEYIKWHLNKIPKVLHLYWGKNKKLSFMKFMTAYSFWKFNPDWKIKIYHPRLPNIGERWLNTEQKSYDYKGPCYFDKLMTIPSVNMIEVDLGDQYSSLSEVTRSDLFRLEILSKEGGIWSDFDILFIRPMTSLSTNSVENANADVLICCHHGFHKIGFIGCSENGGLFFSDIYELYHKYKMEKIEDIDEYQQSGTVIYGLYFTYNKRNKKHILEKKGIDVHNMPLSSVYPVYGSKVSAMYDEKLRIQDDMIGIHWYGGSTHTSKYENVVDHENITAFTSVDLLSIMGNIYIESKMKYSIILPYYKRADQLHNTFMSYAYYYKQRDDYEVIIVEDPKNESDEDEHADLVGIIDRFSKDINIKHIVSHAKVSYNPAPLFNEGVKISSGKFIVLTNPECLHEVNILKGFDDAFDVDMNVYLICGCRHVGLYPKRVERFEEFDSEHIDWYQHSKLSDFGLHFCSAISRYNFDILGGFDERFSKGVDYDDTDFRRMISENNIPVLRKDDLTVIHQKHSKDKDIFLSDEDENPLLDRNRELYYKKRRNDFKLGIGIPHTEKTMNPYFFDCFIAMDKPGFIYMRPPYAGYVGVDSARNSLVQQAIESGCTHLIMMDTDQVYPTDTITKLLSHGKDVVAAKVHRRYPPFDPILYRGTLSTYIHVPDKECFSGDLIEVDATGCGCVMYNMDVFFKIRPPWFMEYRLEKGGNVGEDVGFCSKLREVGFKIYVDTSICIDHMTTMGINESFYRLYTKMNKSKKVESHN